MPGLKELKGLKKEEFLEDYVGKKSTGYFHEEEAENVVDAIMIREMGDGWFEDLREAIAEGFAENEEKGEDTEERYNLYYKDFFNAVDEQKIDFENGQYSDWGKAGTYGDQEFMIDKSEAERIAKEVIREGLEEETHDVVFFKS